MTRVYKAIKDQMDDSTIPANSDYSVNFNATSVIRRNFTLTKYMANPLNIDIDEVKKHSAEWRQEMKEWSANHRKCLLEKNKV